MTHALKSISVAIGDLTSHSANVRGNSPEEYESDAITHLKASIAVLGIIQPLLVQKIDGKFGVLAGGRRRAALNELGLHQQNQDRMPLGARQMRCDHGPVFGREHHPSPDECYRRVRGVCAYDGG